MIPTKTLCDPRPFFTGEPRTNQESGLTKYLILSAFPFAKQVHRGIARAKFSIDNQSPGKNGLLCMKENCIWFWGSTSRDREVWSSYLLSLLANQLWLRVAVDLTNTRLSWNTWPWRHFLLWHFRHRSINSTMKSRNNEGWRPEAKCSIDNQPPGTNAK